MGSVVAPVTVPLVYFEGASSRWTLTRPASFVSETPASVFCKFLSMRLASAPRDVRTAPRAEVEGGGSVDAPSETLRWLEGNRMEFSLTAFTDFHC